MAGGAFKVTASIADRQIELNPYTEEKDIPEDQTLLADEVKKTLIVLKALFDPKYDTAQFQDYFNPLVEIARDGLEGASSNAKIAFAALINLQTEVTTREAGRVKHRYMKFLAKYALSAAVFLFLIGYLFLFASIAKDFTKYSSIFEPKTVGCFFLALSGCSAGVWTSFGARRQTLSFYELHSPDPIQMHPLMRVTFVISLTIIVGLLAHLELVTFGIGNLQIGTVFKRPDLAWLFGAFCGFSEQLISTQVSQQAAKAFKGGPSK